MFALIFSRFLNNYSCIYVPLFILKEIIEFRDKINLDKIYPYHEDFRRLAAIFWYMFNKLYFLKQTSDGIFILLMPFFIRDNNYSECHLLSDFRVPLMYTWKKLYVSYMQDTQWTKYSKSRGLGG